VHAQATKVLLCEEGELSEGAYFDANDEQSGAMAMQAVDKSAPDEEQHAVLA